MFSLVRGALSRPAVVVSFAVVLCTSGVFSAHAQVAGPETLESSLSSPAAPVPSVPDWAVMANRGLKSRAAEVVMLEVDTTPGRPLQVQVPILGLPMTLDLIPHSVRDALYQVFEHRPDGSYVPVKPTPVNTLRGFVRELPTAVVAGGLLDDGLYAQVLLPDGRQVWIQPASSVADGAPRGLHAVYVGGDATDFSAVCTTVDTPGTPTNTGISTRGGTGRSIAQLAIDAEFEFYRDTGSTSRTQDTVNLIVNIVNAQYEREVDIRHTITTIIVRTFQNYNPADPVNNMRAQFLNWWNANHAGVVRDLACMFDGNGNGGQATGNGLVCNTTLAYCGCGVDWPNLSYRCDVVSHELGHLWGSCHCPCNSPPFTMDPIVNYANRFAGAPGNECASNTVAQIVAHRNSRTCLTGATAGTVVPNDSCGNATRIPCDINDRSYVCTFGFHNIGATQDGPGDGCRPGQADIWYFYTAACDGSVTFRTCGSNFDTVLFAYNMDTCPVSTFAQVACNDDSTNCAGQTLSSVITFNTARGQSFLIRIAGFNGAQGQGLLTVDQSFCPRPFNDSCVNAIPVVQGRSVAFSTIGATTGQTIDSGGIPRDSYLEPACATLSDFQISNDIWFSYTVPCAGTTRFSLCGSSFDTKIAVYGGCPTGDNQAFACSDDACGTQSSVDVNLQLGQVVRIRVGGYRGAVGTGTLRVDSLSCPPPFNDACASAYVLSGIGAVGITGTMVGATNDGNATCGISTTGPDVWYTYVAPCDGQFLFSTCGTHDASGVDTGPDTVVSLHSGCPGGGINELPGACSDDDVAVCTDAGVRRDSFVSVSMTAGQQVYARVATFNGSLPPRGHVVNFNFISPAPGNDACADATPVGEGEVAFCTAGASISPETMGCVPGSGDVWFLYTPTCNGTALASLCTSNYDTFLAVFDTAICDGAGAVLLCTDDNGPACAGTPSSGFFPVLAGNSYLIRVFGFSTNVGGGTLALSCADSGSCCDPAQVCTITAAGDCPAGSTYTSGGACEPNPCLVASGACCMATACSVGTADDCITAGGSYQGDATVCGDPGNPTTCCPANYNQVGGLSVQDIFDFLAGYFSGDAQADFNGSGAITVQDIFDFLAAYFAGCA